MIPYGKQNVGLDELRAVADVLASDWLTQGRQVPAFEQALGEYVGAQCTVAVSSGTAALHIACLSIGLEQGDWLWTSTNSFVASANCAKFCGASVDFIDIDINTRNICIDHLKEKLKSASKKGLLPKVVVAVHFSGLPCDMKAIAELSSEYGFYVIEDAAHAIGGVDSGTYIGSCRYSDMTIFSFHPLKTITTAEGGAVCTNNTVLDAKLRLYRSHGIEKNVSRLNDSEKDPWCYEQHVLGFNYRMNDMQAAMGMVQLCRLPLFVAKRQQLAQRYDRLLSAMPLRAPLVDAHPHVAWHLYAIQLDAGISRRKVYDLLVSRNIMVNVHYIPIHTQPYYKKQGFNNGDFPVAEFYYSGALSLPLYVDLSEDDQDTVVNTLEEAIECA